MEDERVEMEEYGNQQIFGGICKSMVDLLGNTKMPNVKRNTKPSAGMKPVFLCSRNA
jgi:hypothetical protein